MHALSHALLGLNLIPTLTITRTPTATPTAAANPTPTPTPTRHALLGQLGAAFHLWAYASLATVATP